MTDQRKLDDPPRVSVVVPLYNKREHIAACVRSVLRQTYPNVETVVVDDGSTDGSANEIECFMDTIRYVRYDNAGPSIARNRGINLATAEFIAFLDADDRWLPTKLATQMDFLVSHPEIVWCATNCVMVGGPPTARRKTLSEWVDDGSEPWIVYEDWFAANTGKTRILTSGVVVKRSVLERVGYFDPEIPSGQDADLWMRIADAYSAYGYCRVPQFSYSVTVEGGISDGGPKRFESLAHLLMKHVRHCQATANCRPTYRQRVRCECTTFVRRTVAFGDLRMTRKFVHSLPHNWRTWEDCVWYAVSFFPGRVLVGLANSRLRLLGLSPRKIEYNWSIR